MERTLRITALPRHDGRTLKQIMQREFGMSGGLISEMKQRENAILVDGAPQWLNYVVCPGQELIFVVEASEAKSETLVPSFGLVDIIFEDEDILVVNKPAGLPCHPVAGNRERTLANFLAHHYESRGQHFIARIINRLDSNTSGLVLFAKNALAAALLNQAPRADSLQKIYTAISLGIPAQPWGEINKNLCKMSDSGIKRQICGPDQGRAAITLYKTLSFSLLRGLALLRIETRTGRTHQIRVHMASIGCPLAGDFLYGTEDPELIPRHALHMGELRLLHPITREQLRFTAPLPPDMRALLYDFTDL